MWHYWNTLTNAYVLLPKAIYGKNNFPSYPRKPNFPTYCATPGMQGWTLEAEGVGDPSPIIVLCPESFTKSVPNELVNTNAQDIGTSLDKMETRSMTWYHEMFHLLFPDVSSEEVV